ncbi:MAG: carbonic anhydrase [Xanthobacteraceae bacterium]
MDALIAGYRRFRAEQWPHERERFEHLSGGQQPRTLVITCSDSRVDPGMIFDAAPGEMFIVRNVANLVPPYAPDAAYHGTSAALEFAVRALQVENIVVMGHAQCGGVKALLEGTPPTVSDFVGQWMQIAEPARQRVMACCGHADDSARQLACEHEVVKLSLDNLRTFWWVRDAIEAGRLRLHGCYFGIRSGVLEVLGADGRFAPVAER